MPPFWMDFRCLKGLQTSKPLLVYVLPGVALVPDFRFLKYWIWELGTSFQIQNGFYEVNRAQTIKLASQDSLPDKNITEKNRLMAEDPNNLPSSLLGNAIDFR